MKRLPQNALVKAMYQRLKLITGLHVYDDVPKEATLPYVTFGMGMSDQNNAKLVDITDTTQEIHIFTDYQGRKQLNNIADTIIESLESSPLDLSADSFQCLSGEVTRYEADSEDTAGYHGVLTFTCKIQNLEM